MEKAKIVVTIFMLAILSTLQAAEQYPITVFQAAQNNSVATLQQLVAQNPDIMGSKNDHGDTPLHCALKGKEPGKRGKRTPSNDAIQYILSREDGQKTLHMRDADKRLPLFLAIISGNPKTVKMLLEANADPNETTPDEQPLIALAAKKKELRIAQHLVFHGAPIMYEETSYENESGLTRLYSTDKYIQSVMLKAYQDRIQQEKKLLRERLECAQEMLQQERERYGMLLASKQELEQQNLALQERLTPLQPVEQLTAEMNTSENNDSDDDEIAEKKEIAEEIRQDREEWDFGDDQ